MPLSLLIEEWQDWCFRVWILKELNFKKKAYCASDNCVGLHETKSNVFSQLMSYFNPYLSKILIGLEYFKRNIYIFCHPQTDCFILSELSSVARLPMLGAKPRWLIRQSKMLPLNLEENSASEGNLNVYVSNLFCLHKSA